MLSNSYKKALLFVGKRRAWMRLMNSRAYDSRIRQQPVCPRPYKERKHPLPCLTDAIAEVVVLLLQPNQGCLRLESLYNNSYILPHIIGRLYE